MADCPGPDDNVDVIQSQRAVVALLEDPRTHGGVSVSRVDTPISHVFIAGPKTYKLKRAVKRNFVDYTTLRDRHEMCEREVAVNRANAPKLYLGVVAIVETPDGLALSGEGRAVDYAVEMTTFDPNAAFDRLADAGALSTNHMVQLADVVAAQHGRSAVRLSAEAAAKAGQIIVQVAEAIQSAPCGRKLASEIADWKLAAEYLLREKSAQLDARGRHGFVRLCHGDLHLGNICLFDGVPTLFDAIEFSEEIASVDVGYDAAFTAMDLLQRGLKRHANAFLSRYLNTTRDYSSLSVLALFVSMRASVRAMVAATGRDQMASETLARQRLKFAAEALSSKPGPRLIAVGGLSGSGKSTLASNIAGDVSGLVGALTIRSDVSRKRLFGVAPEEPLPQSAYSREAGARVYRILQKDAARVLRSGHPVIVDATFLGGDAAPAFERIAGELGVSFDGVWLDLGIDELKSRVAARVGDASDATPAVVEAQAKVFGALPSWHVVDAGGTPSEVARRVLRLLGLARPS